MDQHAGSELGPLSPRGPVRRPRSREHGHAALGRRCPGRALDALNKTQRRVLSETESRAALVELLSYVSDDSHRRHFQRAALYGAATYVGAMQYLEAGWLCFVCFDVCSRKAAALLEHRALWTSELAKQLENLPNAFRGLLQHPANDEALLEALHASLNRKEVEVAGGDPLSGGLQSAAPSFAAATTPPAAPKDLLAGGLGGAGLPAKNLFRKRAIEHVAEAEDLDSEMAANRFKAPHRPKAAAGLDLRKGETAARAAQKQQQVDVNDALEFFAAAEEEPSDDSRAAAAAELAALEKLSHPKHDVRVPETLKNWNLILTLVDHEKFPAVKRTEELEALINGLKHEEPGGRVFDGLLAYQNEVVTKLVPREQVPGLWQALLRILQAPNPKARDVQEALEQAGATARCLLTLPKPEAFRAQKRASWQRDCGVLLALAVAAYRAHIASHLEIEVEEVADPAIDVVEDEEGETVEDDEILAALS